MKAEVPRSITSGSPSVGKPNEIGFGAQRSLGAAERRDSLRRAHRVNSNETFARDHFHEISAAPAHPAIRKADDRKAVRVRTLDGGARHVIHREHGTVVLAVEQHRDARLAHDGHRRTRLLETRAVGDVEQLRQSEVLVAAKRRVDYVIGDDAGVLGFETHPGKGALRERTRVRLAQVYSVWHVVLIASDGLCVT